jgi:hypothetical protein
MANRRKHANTIPVASLARWIVAAVFLGLAGLSYVYVKNQLHATGNELKALERQLADIDTEAELVRTKISALSSHSALQRRLKEGFIKMVPVSDDRIVRLNAAPSERADVRPVSNVGPAK